MPHPSFEHRPSWWPENEAWPPIKGRFRRNPFFRRLGFAFAVFNIFGMLLFFGVLFWVAGLLGLVRLPASFLPWVIGLFIFIVCVILLGVFGLRRVFNPLDDLLEAADRVAKGDYSVRFSEWGSPEVRSLARAFNNMATRLYQADEKRRNLLADVTHELRTPLTVLRGNLEGMLDGVYLSDETNLKALLDETDILVRLVEDLRLVTLAESGALQLKKEPTDILMLVRDTVFAFHPQAELVGVRIVFDSTELEFRKDNLYPIMLDIDPGRMRQVLMNLMANALRYSPPAGQIRVFCQVSPSEFVVDISHEGPGIPSQDLQHIFDRYYKSSDSSGMGLGLAIARYIVTAHGGKIEARSFDGHGSTIRISLVLEANK